VAPAGDKLNLDVKAPLASQGDSKTATVLIVDDNEELLKFLKTVMRNQPWELVSASSAQEALLATAERKVDVALIDYMLPDTDGLTLSRKLQVRQPSLQVILMTGGGEMSFGKDTVSRSRIPILQKPFVVDDLLALITSRVLLKGKEDSAAAASWGN
jgi:DNA-binding NtrC family response regulator